MQDLGQIGMHALALAGGKDDYLDGRFSHFSTPEMTKATTEDAFALSHDGLGPT
jgi:hypothetical protein